MPGPLGSLSDSTKGRRQRPQPLTDAAAVEEVTALLIDATGAGEEWRPVPGTDGLYEASSLGRFRGYRFRVDLDGTPRRSAAPRMLTVNHSDRYPRVNVNGRPHLLHRLVCLAFHGEPARGQAVRHIDGNPFNNRADNLAWGTKAENEADKVAHGTVKLDPEKVRAIRILRTAGWEHYRIASLFDVSKTLVAQVCLGQRWGEVA